MGGLNILVAEDDGLLGILLADLLEAMGHKVCAIETTEAGAVRAAAIHCPDLMILDCRLAEGTGPGAAQQICKTRPVAHIFVTGDGSLIADATTTAVTIEKPYGEELLARAIAQAMINTDHCSAENRTADWS